MDQHVKTDEISSVGSFKTNLRDSSEPISLLIYRNWTVRLKTPWTMFRNDN